MAKEVLELWLEEISALFFQGKKEVI